MVVCLFVGGNNGLLQVGGDDACVNFISQCSVVGIVLGGVVGECDEACVGEGWVSIRGRGVVGESFGLCVV